MPMDAAISARLSSLFPLGAGRKYQTPLWASPVLRGFSIPQRFVTALWLWDKSSTVWERVTCRALSIGHLSLQPPLPEARVVTHQSYIIQPPGMGRTPPARATTSGCKELFGHRSTSEVRR